MEMVTGGKTEPAMCPSAADYARQRLQEREKAAAPAGLSEEYGCTQAHMRHVLADLVDEGDAERVARGKYVAPESVEDDRGDDRHQEQENSGGSHADTGEETTAEDTEGPTLDDDDTVSLPVPGGADGADQEDVDEPADQAAGGADGPGGVPVEVVVVVLVAVAVGWFFLSGSSSSDDQDIDRIDDEEDSAQQTGDGGLVDDVDDELPLFGD